MHSEGTGRGTEIRLRLPRQPEIEAAEDGRPPQPSLQELRVLVVDDNPDVADTLQMLLEASGFDARVAYSGPEAIAAVREDRPDVVLCDIGLPGMDGFAVAGALRSEHGASGLRLVAVTGYGDEEMRRKVLGAGFDAHLIKPVHPETLWEALAEL